MSDFSNYAEGKIYDHVTGRVSWTMPAVAYLALFTAVSDAEAGVGTEVSTGGYARQAVAFGAATDGAGSNSAICGERLDGHQVARRLKDVGGRGLDPVRGRRH